jgi:peptide/nickel transport system permease protein
MGTFLIRRFLQLIAILFIVTLMVFFVMRLTPGNPIVLFLGESATKEQVAYYTQIYGFDKPLPIQYVSWVGNLFHGQMGRSIVFQQDITSLIINRFQVTINIAIPAFIIAVVLGVALGVIAAINRGKTIDSVINVLANIGMATPIFWLGILCIYLLSLKLNLLPAQGYTPLNQNFLLGLSQRIMPITILALGPLATFTRQTRSSMLEVIRQDYIRTARSKGLAEKASILRHALRNAFIPIVTIMGMQLGYMLGGSVLLEQVFNIPGMGNMLITAIINKDYMLVQSGIFVVALCVSICNLLVDLAYGYIDPRIRIN